MQVGTADDSKSLSAYHINVVLRHGAYGNMSHKQQKNSGHGAGFRAGPGSQAHPGTPQHAIEKNGVLKQYRSVENSRHPWVAEITQRAIFGLPFGCAQNGN